MVFQDSLSQCKKGEASLLPFIILVAGIGSEGDVWGEGVYRVVATRIFIRDEQAQNYC